MFLYGEYEMTAILTITVPLLILAIFVDRKDKAVTKRRATVDRLFSLIEQDKARGIVNA